MGGIRTLTIDIGGTGVKMLPIDEDGGQLAERHRELTPKPSTPEAVMAVIKEMAAKQEPFGRVSVGFPGVVKRGLVKTAPNLGTEDWVGFNLQTAIAEVCGKPTRVANDAELQGYGVIDGKGVEIVLTLGTGLGTGLYVNGHLVPNLELAHHPLKGKKTYEDLVSDAELERVGKKKWRKRVELVIETLEPIFNYDKLHIGGGNAKKLKGPLPENVRLFSNVEGLAGGVRLCQDSWD
jgi:polyphosphate glucokinase